MKTFVALACLLGAASALYSPQDAVIELTPSNFNSKVIDSDDLWLIEFYAPWCGHCKNLVPAYKQAAQTLKGVVKVGAVDADAHKALSSQYGISGFPTIKFFGINKMKPWDYKGGRSASDIIEEGRNQAKKFIDAKISGGGGSGQKEKPKKDEDNVVELTDGNFEKLVIQSDDMWLVEFFAPWCGHCKNLAPHWAKAASELKGKVKLGALDATVHTIMANRYNVRGYPSIKYFPAGKKDGEAEEYDGGRTSGDIVNWASEKAADSIPPPEVEEMIKPSTLKMACESNQICVISILPHILDCNADCRNDFLAMLRTMADKYKKRGWGWVWSEAGAQPAVEEAFGIGGFGYPAMAAMNARKMKFALLKGSFGETGVNEFLRELAVGRGSTAPVKDAKLPFVEDREPWDGKDGELPVEEDIDLSDVVLDDLDEVGKDEL